MKAAVPMLANTTAVVMKCEFSAISLRIENIWRSYQQAEVLNIEGLLRSDDK